MRRGARIDSIEAQAYRIPTDGPEGDGTYRWDATTLVTVHARSGEAEGFGYTYTSAVAAALIRELAPCVVGTEAWAVERAWNALVAEVRNIGRPGVAATAIAAVDAALWDLKAKLLELPLVTLLGQVRRSVPVYGSGGFTTYDVQRLSEQLAGWAAQGITRVKMKVGADPDQDVARVRAAHAAVSGRAELMVDANGAYSAGAAVAKAHAFGDVGVTWFEEPVSSDDLAGLRLVRGRAPAGIEVAAGEYAYDVGDVLRMLEAQAVDVMQVDASRCLGITGFIAAARLCQAFSIPMSAHTAPSLHLHVACAVTPLVHVEYFYDHARLEEMLFDGFVRPVDGGMSPDLGRPGIGVELKRADARHYAV